jgi:hypothetical protein
MAKWTKQTEAAIYIRELLLKQGFDIPSRNITLKGDQGWVMFEYKQRQVRIDSASGIWVKTVTSDWRCLSMPATVSGAVMTVDFLLQE